MMSSPKSRPRLQRVESRIIKNYERKPLISDFIQATLDDDSDKVSAMLTQGEDINQKTPGWENTALHYASNSNFFELVKMLLSKGADPDQRNRCNLTPSQLANKDDIREYIRARMKLPEKYITKQVIMRKPNFKDKVISILKKIKAFCI
mgnify:CR=1 FL=1